MATAITDARNVLLEQTKPGTHADHESNAKAAQAITVARYAAFAADGKVLPEVYPPPLAGDGADVYTMADEAGEGAVTYKEFSKFVGRNQNLKNRLREGWEFFCGHFSIENLEDCPKEKFMEIWAAAAAKRTDA
eukprot:TRINITY_DN526_c2_g1_i1.p1 TRINITY_DN526_c2_g1~~TRINITY_DN526_c2_g1_i1.p1  ORF type:complete len:134 (+),score=52.34 TRINITY_DN526_c2_g1_i1:55-456(+)